MVYNAQQIKWNNAHYLWNDFNLGADYQQYLLDTYNIAVDGRAIWEHVLLVEVIVTPVIPSGGSKDYREEERKKIRLIFIMGDSEKSEEKVVKNIMEPRIVSDIKNKLQEQLKAKIILTDVQIIEG